MTSYSYSTRSKLKPRPSNITVSSPTLFKYPQDGQSDPARNVITFTSHDRKLLTPPNYLNDTNISFFMQYHLDNFVPEDIKSKAHVFNSFFFSKIKSIRASKQDSSTYKCASKWIKGVELFSKDFLIFPICEKDHWILAIVCYPYEEPHSNKLIVSDDELRTPAVFVLNSSDGFAPSVKKTLGDFLKFQWHIEKEKYRSFAINQAKTNGIRLIYPTLPQQKNGYNCGVYMLNYFYCFLKDPRKAYINMYRGRDMTDWFAENQIDVSRARKRLQDIVTKQIHLWFKSDNNNKSRAQEEQELIELSSPDEDCQIEIDCTDTKTVILIN